MVTRGGEAVDEEVIEDIDGVHPPLAVSDDDIKMGQIALEKVCSGFCMCSVCLRGACELTYDIRRSPSCPRRRGSVPLSARSWPALLVKRTLPLRSSFAL